MQVLTRRETGHSVLAAYNLLAVYDGMGCDVMWRIRTRDSSFSVKNGIHRNGINTFALPSHILQHICTYMLHNK